MATNPKKWAQVVEEMLSPKPRLATVQAQMRSLGVEPGADLVECMEKALNRLEPATKERLLSKRSKINEL
ncbi:MAG: hypothetical protein AB7N80_06045 [Bdellovibrionales bacterium]